MCPQSGFDDASIDTTCGSSCKASGRICKKTSRLYATRKLWMPVLCYSGGPNGLKRLRLSETSLIVLCFPSASPGSSPNQTTRPTKPRGANRSKSRRLRGNYTARFLLSMRHPTLFSTSVHLRPTLRPSVALPAKANPAHAYGKTNEKASIQPRGKPAARLEFSRGAEPGRPSRYFAHRAIRKQQHLSSCAKKK